MKFLLTVLMLLLATHSYAGLNKWVDENGKVHYSDSAPPDVKVKKLKSASDNYQANIEDETAKPAAAQAAPAPAKTIAEQERDRKKKEQDQAKAEQKAQQEKENETNKRKNCENARSSLSTLQNSPRIVSYNEQGERIYMDDTARSAQQEEARKAISQYCN